MKREQKKMQKKFKNIITEEEHNFILEEVKLNPSLFGKKITHPIELGEISLERILFWIRKIKQSERKKLKTSIFKVIDRYIEHKIGRTDMKCWGELEELKTVLNEDVFEGK